MVGAWKLVNINDNIVYKPEHYDKARKIIKRLPKFYNIICIGGESGTGKSEISSIVSSVFYKPLLVTLDKFYLVCPALRTAWRRKYLEQIGHKEIDWEAVEFLINNTNKFPIIIEGLYACKIKMDDVFSVYLEGTYKETEQFRRERKKEKQTEFRKKVLRLEHKEVMKTKKFANLII